jgi:hypothetical protein
VTSISALTRIYTSLPVITYGQVVALHWPGPQVSPHLLYSQGNLSTITFVYTGASEAHHEIMTGTAAHIIELDDIAEAGFRRSFVLESSMAR